MIDMELHAKASTDIRRASDYARGIADNLRKINDGPVFDHEREKLVGEVDSWFSALASLLGKETA